MNLLSKLLRGNQVQEDLRRQIIVSAAGAEALKGENDADIKWKQDLAFKYEAIHDEDAEAILAQKCLQTHYYPKTDENGNFIYVRNGKGEVMLDGAGNPIIQYEKGFIINDTFAALKQMLSHTNRLVFLDPKEKRLMELYMEEIVEDAKMAQKEDDFDLAQSSYLDSLNASLMLLVSDACNGNKVKAMLEHRKITSLDVMPQANKKGVF